jgi:DNA-binding NarL/FixJ family response regulator
MTTSKLKGVAVLAREGLSNREIASRLFLSVRPVENHVYRALRKLHLGGRADLRDWDPGRHGEAGQ